MKYKANIDRHFYHIISAPFIYMIIIPTVFLDIMIEIYHHICFPLYNIPLVPRKKFILIDRHKLKYLNWREKINCAYCGYANGVYRYAKAIGAETEKYWCGIMHEEKGHYIPQKHHVDFIEYNDEQSYRKLSK